MNTCLLNELYKTTYSTNQIVCVNVCWFENDILCVMQYNI